MSSVLFTILTVFVLLASALLTIIVLLQNGKGGGLASNFVAGNQTFGVRQTTDILEKITWYLVAFVGIGAIVVNVFTLNPAKDVDYTEQVTATEAEAIAIPSQDAPATPVEEAPAAEAQN